MAGTAGGFESSALRGDGRRTKVHPSDVRGRFITQRRVLFAALLVFYGALPLVEIGGHPAVHLDITGRRFFLFGATFNAQDFWLVLLLVTTATFAVVFVTAWFGRIWCGWACPQTVFLEALYRPIERLIEGPAERRKRDRPWDLDRVSRFALKHACFVAISLVVSQVFMALFVSTKDLGAKIVQGPAAHPGPFIWSMAVTFGLYFNFAWFREQLCLVVCPYGRLQSSMQDADTLIVGYDKLRGDPRARLFKARAERQAGDCVDCRRCVQVCPTGIDIRNGLQMECLGCTQCIDACDEVMEKIGYAKGLIRYDSQNGFDRRPKRILRGRLVAYGGLLAISLFGLLGALLFRSPFEANLLRAPGIPWIKDGATVRNQFTLHLVNKHPNTSTFEIEVSAGDAFTVVVPQPKVTLETLKDAHVPIFVSTTQRISDAPLRVMISGGAGGQTRELEARFIGPRAR